MTTSLSSSVLNSWVAERWHMCPSMSHYWLLIAPVMSRSSGGNYSCFVISCMCCQCHSQMPALQRYSPCVLAHAFFPYDPWILWRQLNIPFRSKHPTVIYINTLSSHVSLSSPLNSGCGTVKGRGFGVGWKINSGWDHFNMPKVIVKLAEFY